MAEKKFIQKAIKRPGALTEKAKRAGESINEFAEGHKHDSGTTGQEARFYENVLKPATHEKLAGGHGHKPAGEKHSSDGKGHWSGH